MLFYSSSAASWAHPRVSGENISAFALNDVINGSSPRERGKPALTQLSCAATGLIPA